MAICSGEDISTEILLRLPVKSVVKFQTVSKLWLSIVSTRRFRSAHASRHSGSAAPRGLFFAVLESAAAAERPEDLFFNRLLRLNTDTDDQIKPEISEFVHRVNWPAGSVSPLICTSSCNGLLLLESERSGNFGGAYKAYYVYNPTTKDYKVIDTTGIRSHGASLAFDPSQSHHYKIIFLFSGDYFGKEFQIQVYSSATGTCKPPLSYSLVRGIRYSHFGYKDNCGVYWNGAIHWLSYDATSVVYFNVHTERIGNILTPSFDNTGQYCHYFGESQGHLHIVYSNNNLFWKSTSLHVYELKRDYYSYWILKYNVDHFSVLPAVPQVDVPEAYGTYLSIFRDEEGDYSTMVFLDCDRLVEYNFKKKSIRRLDKNVDVMASTSRPGGIYRSNTHQFIPTLSCV